MDVLHKALGQIVEQSEKQRQKDRQTDRQWQFNTTKGTETETITLSFRQGHKQSEDNARKTHTG